MDYDLYLLIILILMITAAVLFVHIGVGSCGWPNSARILCMRLASFAFTNCAPSVDLAANADTVFKAAHVIVILS